MKTQESKIIDYLLETGASFKKINKVINMSNKSQNFNPKYDAIDFGVGTIDMIIDGKPYKGRPSSINPLFL